MSHVTSIGAIPRVRAILFAALAAVIALTALAAAPNADAKKKKKKPVPVKVMTRNIFLGADLGPALRSQSFEEFTAANDQILDDVEQTDFPRRAVALAAEIKRKRPDLVGLQEVAWWRMNETPGLPRQSSTDPQSEFTATTTIVDFLAELRKQLAAQGADYKVAVSKDEFDFEAPADTDDNPETGLFGGDIQGRLTMRDVILVKDSKKVKYKNPTSGTFQNLFTADVSGIEVAVTRGWTALDAKVKKGKGKKKRSAKFHFVNSHFEAFDDEQVVPSIRAKQAEELVTGPANQKRTIILGDFNSDVDTEVQPGDSQAYEVLLGAGFTDLTIDDAQNSCCIPDLFTGPPSEFDHQVDHIMSNMGRKAKLVNGEVLGREAVNGIYPSDHAGVFSKLKLKAKK